MLRAALESGEEATTARAALAVYAELTRAQVQTEEMLLSQDGKQHLSCGDFHDKIVLDTKLIERGTS